MKAKYMKRSGKVKIKREKRGQYELFTGAFVDITGQKNETTEPWLTDQEFFMVRRDVIYAVDDGHKIINEKHYGAWLRGKREINCRDYRDSTRKFITNPVEIEVLPVIGTITLDGQKERAVLCKQKSGKFTLVREKHADLLQLGQPYQEGGNSDAPIVVLDRQDQSAVAVIASLPSYTIKQVIESIKDIKENKNNKNIDDRRVIEAIER